MKHSEIEPLASMVTTASTKVTLKDGRTYAGFFHKVKSSPALEKINKWSFVEHNNSVDFRKENDEKYATILNGDDIQEIKYPG